jgi:hypothetical protein
MSAAHLLRTLALAPGNTLAPLTAAITAQPRARESRKRTTGRTTGHGREKGAGGCVASATPGTYIFNDLRTLTGSGLKTDSPG